MLLIAYSTAPLSECVFDTTKASNMQTVTDFTADTSDLGWYIQNDNVMGGKSTGDFKLNKDVLIFSGYTNTDGGGFSSIRTSDFRSDMSEQDGICVRVKGDGRRYSWQLQTNATWRGKLISYWADFTTIENEWLTISIPFTDFKPQFRGMQLDGPKLDRDQLTSMGLYIYDKQDGAFTIHLNKVSAYRADRP